MSVELLDLSMIDGGACVVCGLLQGLRVRAPEWWPPQSHSAPLCDDGPAWIAGAAATRAWRLQQVGEGRVSTGGS
jgi:hypothetical protein